MSDPHRVSPPLLLSEVHRTEKPADLLDADFAIQNRSSSPQAVTLVGTSCSCYGVMLDGAPWQKGNSTTLLPGAQQLLTFDVQPPVQPSEKSWSVRVASGLQERVLTLSVRVFRDLTLEPEAIFVSLPPAVDSPSQNDDQIAEPAGAAANGDQRHRLVITHTWRRNDRSSGPPTITGLPEWIVFSPPRKMDASQVVAPGLLRQSWETEVAIDIPEKRTPKTVHTGIQRFQVGFGGTSERNVHDTGRIVLEETPGITAPTVVHWGQVSQDIFHKRRLVLASNDQRPFHIEKAQLLIGDQADAVELTNYENSPDDQSSFSPGTTKFQLSSPQMTLTVNLEPNAQQSRQFASLELAPGQPGPLMATLLLDTDHPLTPTLEIRLRAFALESSSVPEAAGG